MIGYYINLKGNHNVEKTDNGGCGIGYYINLKGNHNTR